MVQSLEFREAIKQTPAYSNLLSLHIRDISTPIQIKNGNFAFGWKRNDNLYPPDGPANEPARFKGEGWEDWFDKFGRFRDTFTVYVDGTIRKSSLGASPYKMKSFPMLETLDDWERSFNFLHAYLVNKYLPTFQTNGITLWSDADKHENRDFVAIKTLFELNKSMERTMLFEEYDQITNGKVTIPYTEGGPLTWNKETKHFGGYVSDLQSVAPELRRVTPRFIDVTYNGATINYQFSHADKDGSDEDIYGWNYKSTNGKFQTTFLLINT